MNTPQQQNRPDTISQANMAAPPRHSIQGQPNPVPQETRRANRPMPPHQEGAAPHPSPSRTPFPGTSASRATGNHAGAFPPSQGRPGQTPGSNSAIQPPHASPTRRPSSPVPLFRATSASTAGTPPAGKRLGPLPPTRSTASPSPATKQAGVSPFPDSPGFRQRSGRLHRNEPGG